MEPDITFLHEQYFSKPQVVQSNNVKDTIFPEIIQIFRKNIAKTIYFFYTNTFYSGLEDLVKCFFLWYDLFSDGFLILKTVLCEKGIRVSHLCLTFFLLKGGKGWL